MPLAMEMAPSPTSSTSSTTSFDALLADEATPPPQISAHRVMFGRDVIQVPLKEATSHEYVNLVLSQREFDAMAVHVPQYEELPPEELLERITQLLKDAESKRRHRAGSTATEPSDSLAAFQSRLLELEYERKRLHTKLKAAKALQSSVTEENTTLRVQVQELEQHAVDVEQIVQENELLREQTLHVAGELGRWKHVAQNAQTQLKEVAGALRELKEQVADEREEVLLTTQDALAMVVDDVNQREQVLQQQYLTEKREREMMAEKYYELSGRIRVFCRLRPGHADETTTPALVLPRPNNVLVANSGKEFAFDQVFGPQSTQAEVYAQLEPLVVSFTDGYNACIMAYGQTGSGKTHTMVGNNEGELEHRANGLTVHANAGMIPRALQQVFAVVKKRQMAFSDSLRVSMIEIYNDQILDLLHEGSSGGGKNAVAKSETDITARDVTGYAEVDAVMRDGNANRNIAATKMNLESSRSHALVFLHLESQHHETREVRTSTLCLVDLAGSERISRSQVEGDRLRETQHINKSLSALGDVVYALQHKAKHTPYRNSKLTYMLRDMLSGQAKTLLMLQLSPDTADVEETTCSLQFGARVSQVQMGAVKPSVESGALFKLQEDNRALEAKTVAIESLLGSLQRQHEQQEEDLREARSSKEALERQLWLFGGRRRAAEAVDVHDYSPTEDRSPSPSRPPSPTPSAKSSRSVSSTTSARSARSVRSIRSTQSSASSVQRPNTRRSQLSTPSRQAGSASSTRSSVTPGAASTSSAAASRLRRPGSILDREARRKSLSAATDKSIDPDLRRKSLSAAGIEKVESPENRRRSLSTLQSRSLSALAAPRSVRASKESSPSSEGRVPLHPASSHTRRNGSSPQTPCGATRQSASASRLSSLSRPRNAKAPASSPPRSTPSSTSATRSNPVRSLHRSASTPTRSPIRSTRSNASTPKSTDDTRRSSLSSNPSPLNSDSAASARRTMASSHSGFGWK